MNNTHYILEQTSFLKGARPSPGNRGTCRQAPGLAIRKHGWALPGGRDGTRLPERSPPLGSSGAPADVGLQAQESTWGSDFETSRGWVGGRTGCCVHSLDLMLLETACGTRVPTLSSFQL